MGKEQYEVKFVEQIWSRGLYIINGIQLEMREIIDEYYMSDKIKNIGNALIDFKDFRKSGLSIPVRDFMLIGYLFFNKELQKYLLFYIKELILNNDKNKITEVLILKYIFNTSMTEVQYTIHSSQDTSSERYNDKLKELIKNQYVIAKMNIIKIFLVKKDVEVIRLKIKQLGINFFIDKCSDEFIEEATEYFKYIVEEIIIPRNLPLTLNYVFAFGMGISKKEAKDTKNAVKSKERESLYARIECIIKNSRTEFSMLCSEMELLNEIEVALRNISKLNSGELIKLKPNRILMICLNIYENEFKEYIDNICNQLISEDIDINRINVIMAIFDGIDAIQANHMYTYYKMKTENMVIEDIIIKKSKEQIKVLESRKININDDIWVVYSKNKETLIKKTLDFSIINNSVIKKELKSFYKFIYDKDRKYKSDVDGISRIIMSSKLVIESVVYFQQNLKINSANQIKLLHVHKLLKYLQNDYKSKNNRNIKVSTIVSCITNLKIWINWLMDENMIGISKPESNPFEYVKIRGVNNKNTKIIPECVIEQLLTNIDSLKEDIQRMLLIMLNCGMRFKEVAMLEEDCIEESNSECKVLKYIPYKVLEARRRNGLDDYHRIVIDNEIYKEIQAQCEFTKELREYYSASEIFLRVGNNDNLHVITNSSFCDSVQKLINRCNIVDEQGQLWKISSKQYRKTLAVDMITKGNANPREVSAFLGHLNEDTTNKYYNEVRKMKLSEMNSEFFKKKFKLLMNPNELEKFSEEERKLLYVDFCLNTREVEYGVCMKSFSLEPCSKRGEVFACATCSKICTGKKYLKRWQGLYLNQKNRVETMIKKYDEYGIGEDEYRKFREFERENYLLESFKVVLDKLLKGGGCDFS